MGKKIGKKTRLSQAEKEQRLKALREELNDLYERFDLILLDRPYGVDVQSLLSDLSKKIHEREAEIKKLSK